MNKIILHLDFNSFFASVEQQANPFLRGKAIAVAGKGKQSIDLYANRSTSSVSLSSLKHHRTVITTASKEAKARGVKTAMSSTQAKRLCPELIIIPGDPQKYSKVTAHFLEILKRYSDSVEQFSTDEAFADVTIAAGDYFSAVFLAEKIRHDIKKEIGIACTASIGIGPNKLIAKLAGESIKPNGLTVVQPHELASFMRNHELQAICGIGKQTEEHLHKIGITSIESLQKTPLSVLVSEFKSYGHFLHLAANGIGSDEVSSLEEEQKSISHSYTFPYELFSEQEIKKNLLALCDKVASRLRKKSFTAKQISVYARYNNFGGFGMQKVLPHSTEDGLEIFQIAWSLLKDQVNEMNGIRLLGISTSDLQKIPSPESLFVKPRKVRETLQALDTLQAKHGAGIWQRAATLGTHFKMRTSGWHYDHEL